MRVWWNKYGNWLLIAIVVVVGAAAIYLYADKFGANGFSKKTEDWANFATYISGTVGVAAVVATLMAFVKTLGQQQKLIDSQDELISDQKKQLKLSEAQLFEAIAKEKRDIAFANIRDVLPLILAGFKRSLEFRLEPPVGSSAKVFLDELNVGDFHDYKLKNVIKKLCSLNGFVENGKIDKSDFRNYVVQLFGNTQHLCNFLVENLAQSESLFYASDALLSEVVDDKGWTYWDYIQRNLAFLSGHLDGYDEMPFRKVLREQKSYHHINDRHLGEFQELGVLLK
ncbi:MAG: hypothetical protein ACTH5D_10845 [Halomonas sp.]|uniref:hypothetical protein n=1 Tax=Halomonas sp. TaxID=1486246 RepID=UPI003F906AEE